MYPAKVIPPPPRWPGVAQHISVAGEKSSFLYTVGRDFCGWHFFLSFLLNDTSESG